MTDTLLVVAFWLVWAGALMLASGCAPLDVNGYRDHAVPAGPVHCTGACP